MKNLCFSIMFTNLMCISSVYSELSCVTCSSNDTDNCAQNPRNVFNKNCSTRHSACYVRIEDGVTIRGCVENTEEELKKIGCYQDNKSCEVCNFDGCNGDVFPAHRAECYQCEGDSESDCFTQPNKAAPPCLLYIPNDRCYIWRSEKKFKRGCLSGKGSSICKNQDDCYTCDGASCNFLKGDDESISVKDTSSMVTK